MERFDPLYAPLTGLNLIEASAGTGKTYALTALYLRLVMEAAIPVNRILVVTYTNAATKELRDRIRERLGQIRRAFQRGRAEEDDEFSLRMLDVLPDRELAIRRLNNAVRGFDEAAIFTIHGFCQRVVVRNRGAGRHQRPAPGNHRGFLAAGVLSGFTDGGAVLPG